MKKTSAKSIWWLWLGAVSYAAIFGYSVNNGALTLDSYLPIDLIEWLAASAPYFFIGALFGAAIDFILARRASRDAQISYWVWYVLAFLIVSIASAFILAPGKSFMVKLIFPLAYGVFFVVFAGEAIFGTFADTLIGRTGIGLAVLSASAAWIWFELRSARTRLLARRVLIAALMLFFTVGAVSCAAQIG